MYAKRILFFIIGLYFPIVPFGVDPIPLLSMTMPQVHLVGPARYENKSLCVGERRRRATSSGVHWFHNNECLAVVNLGEEYIYTFLINKEGRITQPLQVLTNTNGAQFASPENFSFSKEGTLLAVSNSLNGKVNIYNVDPKTHLISPSPIITLKHKLAKGIHGVRFSPSSEHLAFTAINGPEGAIYINKVSYRSEGKPQIELCFVKTNEFSPLKPKALDFSPDNKFVAVAYSLRAKYKAYTEKEEQSMIAIYAFNSETGALGTSPLSVTHESLLHPEDVIFFPDGSHIIATNQANDTATVFEFNRYTGTIGKKVSLLKSPEAMLHFPHGVIVSTDTKYLAITNYGSNRVNIYRIQT